MASDTAQADQVKEAEFVVVGAGLLGLSTAWALARRGREVTVLEAVEVGHPAAGSKGAARIFRVGYDEPDYVRMAQQAEARWADLAEESGLVLLERTGQLTFGRDLPTLLEALRSCGADCALLTAKEVASLHGNTLPAAEAVFEPASGVLRADRCLAALQRTAPFELITSMAAAALRDDGDRVVVETLDGPFHASVVVVCAGAASGQLAGLTGVPAQTTTLEQVAYLPLGTGPSLIVIDRSEPLFYALPVPGSATLKVGLHGGAPAVDRGAPVAGDDPELLGTLLRAARRMLPAWEGDVVATERCVYDNSPDRDFIVDRVGRVVIGAGTSGHGFKFGPVLGEGLADLAMGLPCAPELHRFRTAGRSTSS